MSAVAEGLDLSTAGGEALAGVLTVMAQLERRMIGERVREAMAQAKARGVRLGRSVEHSDAVRDLAVDMREAGATLQQIADRLTGDGAPTPRGGRWHGNWPEGTGHGCRQRYSPAWLAPILRSQGLGRKYPDTSRRTRRPGCAVRRAGSWSRHPARSGWGP